MAPSRATSSWWAFACLRGAPGGRRRTSRPSPSSGRWRRSTGARREAPTRRPSPAGRAAATAATATAASASGTKATGATGSWW
uniref:Uncharacterized protein n=1 Tax=Ixodes ricinus TaxID=34613 RepID=A0A6B0TXD1_IXORI